MFSDNREIFSPAYENVPQTDRYFPVWLQADSIVVNLRVNK